MTTGPEIRFEVRGAVGIVRLDRPRALNALTLPMIRAFDRQLALWGADPAVAAVVVRGAGGKAFCAGGDLRAIWDAGRRGDPLTVDFFRAEYRLNRRIKTLAKPYLALIDGVTMGGGVGISVHGSRRVASERTLFAMPETRIGFFPDVGGSFFLPRLPDRLGLYLALTGARLGAADALHAGIATHYVESALQDALVSSLAEADWSSGAPERVVDSTLDRCAGDPGPAPLAARRNAIARCFSGSSLAAIFSVMAKEGGDWASDARNALEAASPTSLAVTFEELRRGASLDFDACLVMEFRLSQAFMAGHDFYEGVRAAIVDKDSAPRWRPASPAEVDGDLVARHFAPPAAGDLTFA